MTPEQIADRPTPTYATSMHRDDRLAGARQMLEDLNRLAREDGCIAAAWAADFIEHARPEAFPLADDVPCSVREGVRTEAGLYDVLYVARGNEGLEAGGGVPANLYQHLENRLRLEGQYLHDPLIVGVYGLMGTVEVRKRLDVGRIEPWPKPVAEGSDADADG